MFFSETTMKTDVEIFCKVVEGRVACNHTSRHYIEICPQFTDTKSVTICAILSCVSCVLIALTVCARKHAYRMQARVKRAKVEQIIFGNNSVTNFFGYRRAAVISTCLTQVLLTVFVVILVSLITGPLNALMISIAGIVVCGELVPVLCGCCRTTGLPRVYCTFVTLLLSPLTIPLAKIFECYSDRRRSNSISGSNNYETRVGEKLSMLERGGTFHSTGNHIDQRDRKYQQQKHHLPAISNCVKHDEYPSLSRNIQSSIQIRDCYTPLSELTIIDLNHTNNTMLVDLFPSKLTPPQLVKECDKPILVRRTDLPSSEERNLQLLDTFSLLKEVSKSGSFPSPISNLLHRNAEKYCLYLAVVSEDANVMDVARLLLRGPTTVALVTSQRESRDRGSIASHNIFDKVAVLLQIPSESDDVDIPENDGPLEIRLKMGANTLGRQQSRCTGCIPSRTVSKLHAIINIDAKDEDAETGEILESKALIVDCGSVNGTFMNGTRLLSDEKHEIPDSGAIISFGSAKFAFNWANSVSISSRLTKSHNKPDEEILGIVTQRNLLSALVEPMKCEENTVVNGPISISI